MVKSELIGRRFKYRDNVYEIRERGPSREPNIGNIAIYVVTKGEWGNTDYSIGTLLARIDNGELKWVDRTQYEGSRLRHHLI